LRSQKNQVNLSRIKRDTFLAQECANILQINRSTVAAYLDADKLFDVPL